MRYSVDSSVGIKLTFCLVVINEKCEKIPCKLAGFFSGPLFTLITMLIVMMPTDDDSFDIRRID